MNFEPTVLAIDTSCDETSASVVRGLTVLSNVLPSQMEYHKKYGGVVPNLARLAHQERIDNVIKESMKIAQVDFNDLDAIAVTLGPGLAIALEVGINKAKELAEKQDLPLLTINHMEGHLLSSLALRKSQKSDQNSEIINPKFPILGFLISGKHCELVVMKNFGQYEKIGETLDDSAGEAFDKCGRMLGLGYPAGPVVSEFAKQHRNNMTIEIRKDNLSTILHAEEKESGASYQLPIPMMNSGDLNFSFSGLKTAFSQLVNSLADSEITVEDQMKGRVNGLTKEQILDLSVTLEAAILEHLRSKLEMALRQYKVSELWLGGGVVASSRLRSVLRSTAKQFDVRTKYPFDSKLTTDNAAMIGVAANIKIMKTLSSLSHNPSNGVYIEDFDLIDRDPSLSL